MNLDDVQNYRDLTKPVGAVKDRNWAIILQVHETTKETQIQKKWL